ncbi:MAG: GlsB/YeaQ/YmgE family stress response membrane protein [Acidobacteria bacterium]|nr:GlsB/YeaQ/YmgE family stress response membrane protein [Acidobacteriota bacterium]MCI0620936.1 GlsB/YeaQ/YmgE family stress response membrane protein [Acidobacteriota bacterium]MCI0720624.1 GlsB/YeaQ/YmgE family stress response membrane protein [Acidobacteriota bacterium]
MSWLWTIFIGLVAGALAKLLMPGKDPGGIVITILLGIVGSVIATFLGQAVGWYAPGTSTGLIGSTLGAILILAVYRFFKKEA